MHATSKYLAKLTIASIGDLFKDANKIKQWFAQSARQVALTGQIVKWTTPLNLPCAQPYKRINKLDMITTVLQNISIAKSLDDQPVHKGKQNTAFPPNFVHSLDSTHMIYTALKCF